MNTNKKFQKFNLEKPIIIHNKKSEFDADLENHPLGNQNMYRLYFINYHRIGDNSMMGHKNVGVINWPFKPFMLPEGMSRADAFKVLSYLTDYIEKETDLKPCSFRSVAALDKVIDLERLGFKRLEINLDNDSSDVINLFTITGRVLLFKKSKQYERYFEWYTEGVTFNEVKNIYKKCGIEFFDLVLVEKNEDKQFSNNPQLIRRK